MGFNPSAKEGCQGGTDGDDGLMRVLEDGLESRAPVPYE
jgi:hypothetical protein